MYITVKFEGGKVAANGSNCKNEELEETKFIGLGL